MIILGGTASNSLEEKIAKFLGCKASKVESKIFPDGESYIRIPISVEDEDVYIVQSLYYPQDKHIIELLLIAETVKDLKASSVTAIIPYLAYARQDRRFKDGEALSVKTILGLIHYSGVNKLIVVEPHKVEALGFFKGEIKIVSLIEEIAKAINEFVDNSNSIVLSPDRGGLERARKLAEFLSTNYAHLEKSRNRDTGEVSMNEDLGFDLTGKEVIIIDDIISTGGTIRLATKIAKRKGAKKVIIACIHPLFNSETFSKILEEGVDHIIVSNTIPVGITSVKLKVIDVAKNIAMRVS